VTYGYTPAAGALASHDFEFSHFQPSWWSTDIQNTSKYSKHLETWNQYTVMSHSSMQHTANARCLMSIAWSTGETVDVKGRKVPVLSWSDVIEMGGSLAWRGYDGYIIFHHRWSTSAVPWLFHHCGFIYFFIFHSLSSFVDQIP
jgi:hypothetical protein